ncbi:MAG: ABC transporter ATP-binding protein [Phycisphaerales bacterium]|nr:ABC transporter ATP-binding protein [Phycisphaerales bacterium]
MQRTHPFWSLARRMLRYQALAFGALGFAFVAAGSLGGGLVALVPVMKQMLAGQAQPGEESVLLSRIHALDTQLGGAIPDAWINALPQDVFHQVAVMVAVLALLTVIGAIAGFMHSFLSLTVATRTIADIRRVAFMRMLHMPLSGMGKGGPSDLISRVINDTASINRGFQAITSKAIAQITKGAASLVAALIINWKLTLVTLAVAPILVIIIRKLSKRIRRASRGAMRSQAKLLGAATEAMHGLRVVKVHNAERAETGRFTRINRDVLRDQLRARTAKALSAPLTETITIFVLGILALIAAKAILDGHLSATEFIAALTSLGIAGSSLKPLNAVIQDVQVAKAAAERIDLILAADLEDDRDTKRPRLAPHTKSITFESIRFTYAGADRPSINSISLTIPHGQTVAFVGPNGSGKTTLLSLVPRLFEPTAGRILIDDTDIAAVSLRSLRKQIGVVTQETILFAGTIASNIAYARPDATREQVIDAAKRAHAHTFISALADGYDHAITDRGLNLSGGQRQRIAIARAILRDPSILIMDEATSMIDSESEAQIAAALREFGTGRTCLIVAHRLSTVVNADMIVVLDHGKIAATGTHDELLESSPLYQNLARHQLVPTNA